MNKKLKLLSLVVGTVSALHIICPLAGHAGDRKENEDDQTTVNTRIIDEDDQNVNQIIETINPLNQTLLNQVVQENNSEVARYLIEMGTSL